MQNVAIPMYGSRVSPRFLHSDTLLIVSLEEHQLISQEVISTIQFSETDWLEELERFHVKHFICGGIEKHFREELEKIGITVTNNVAGNITEILQAIKKNKLSSGYGIANDTAEKILFSEQTSIDDVLNAAKSNGSATFQSDAATHIDCVNCSEKVCLRGKVCPNIHKKFSPISYSQQNKDLLEVAAEIAEEPERVLCRVAELTYFCLGMEYKHLGIAFCVDLFSEAETLTKLLRRFFTVTSVCCKVNFKTKDEQPISNRQSNHICNAAAMSSVLNHATTELNIMVGLSMGSDIVFTKLSNAPVTTLFVKDKLLANNPIGAIYSNYQLERLFKPK